MINLPLLASFPSNRESIRILEKELGWTSQQHNKALVLFDQGLPPLVDAATLPYLFGLSSKLIGAMGRFPERYYRVFKIPKKSGGIRDIEAPRRFLKLIQRWIHEHILANKQFPSYVTGYVKGRSIYDNARFHLRGRNLLVVDIQNFFPSVKGDTILSVFWGFGFSETVAHQLSSLCTLDGRLPQGAPTSPALANLAFREVDTQLNRFAKDQRCFYTRYADDLAFSGSKLFIKRDIIKIAKILKDHGFVVNRSKSRIIGPGGQQIVTGIVVNRVAQPPRYKRRLWRSIFHRASKHPREFFDQIRELQGIASLVNQFNPKLSSRYLKVVSQVSKQLLLSYPTRSN